jgi:hypothetical protein
VGKHASGPPPDPDDEIREMFRVDIEDRAKRTGWQVCAVTVAGGLSAWAVSAFTGGLLGPWRFALVVPIALYTAYTGIFAVVFLALALAAKTTAKGAPRWLRSCARHGGDGVGGLLAAGFLAVVFAPVSSQPQCWWIDCTIAGAAFAAGIAAGIVRRRRRRTKWRNARGPVNPT